MLEQNSPIVNTGDKLILFDTGMGSSKAFGPTTGRQQKSMAEAGIKPADIDAVVCSHAHIDHIGGIVDANDKPLFPNAQIYISQVDFDFWTDEGKLGSPLKDFVVHARKNLLPVRDRIVFFKDGQEFLPGVQAISAPGHTVGHSIFTVASAGKSFAFLGDLSHHSVLLLERPRMEFSYDSDPKQAAGIARQTADDAGGQQDSRDVLSLRVAGLRPRRQGRRRLPLLSRTDADDAVGLSDKARAVASAARVNHAAATHVTSAAQHVGNAAEIPGDDVPVAGRFEVDLLQRTVFGGTRAERGLQAVLLGGGEIAVVGGDHHHLRRLQTKQTRGSEIGFGIGLVVLEQLCRHHEVPREALRTSPMLVSSATLPFDSGEITNFDLSRVRPATLSGQGCRRCQPLVR